MPLESALGKHPHPVAEARPRRRLRVRVGIRRLAVSFATLRRLVLDRGLTLETGPGGFLGSARGRAGVLLAFSPESAVCAASCRSMRFRGVWCRIEAG